MKSNPIIFKIFIIIPIHVLHCVLTQCTQTCEKGFANRDFGVSAYVSASNSHEVSKVSASEFPQAHSTRAIPFCRHLVHLKPMPARLLPTHSVLRSDITRGINDAAARGWENIDRWTNRSEAPSGKKKIDVLHSGDAHGPKIAQQVFILSYFEDMRKNQTNWKHLFHISTKIDKLEVYWWGCKKIHHRQELSFFSIIQ